MPTLIKIRSNQSMVNGTGGTTTWKTGGFVWTAGGTQVASSDPQSVLTFQGQPVFITHPFSFQVEEGETYYYGVGVTDYSKAVLNGHPACVSPTNPQHTTISTDGSTDNSSGHTPGSWLPMYDSDLGANAIIGTRYELTFFDPSFPLPNNTKIFFTQSGVGGGGAGNIANIRASAREKEYGAIFTMPVFLKSDFSGTPRKGDATLTVNFTDHSTGDTPPTTWLWTFGDGGPTSSLQNPSHDYTAAGRYTVSLMVTNGSDPDSTNTKEFYILVTEPCAATVQIAASEGGGRFAGGKNESPIILINGGHVCFEAHVTGTNPQGYKWSLRENGSGDPFSPFSLGPTPIKSFNNTFVRP